MIRWVKFIWEQRRIQRWMDKNSRDSNQAINKARAEGADAEKLHAIGYDFFIDGIMSEYEMILLNHNYYVKLTRRRLIPVPEFMTEGGEWVEAKSQPGHYHLTPKALHELRASIRHEKKERREGWLTWIIAITGLVGALSGLLAIYSVVM